MHTPNAKKKYAIHASVLYSMYEGLSSFLVLIAISIIARAICESATIIGPEIIQLTPKYCNFNLCLYCVYTWNYHGSP